ncbi:MAG: extracellular solute-binding protein [Armatimonadetes bacterium]|nr:extracellular solute-binding protein [Armatimonadota bacterium]
MTRRQALAWMTAAATLPLGCRASDDGRTVIRVANWGGAGDDSDYFKMVRSLYDRYSDHDPTSRVRVELVPGSQEYVSKLLLDHIAGAMPDVVTIDASSAAVFIDNGLLADLTPFAESDPTFDLDGFFPNVVDIARRGKGLFAVPIDFTPMVLYCNARHFREAGVPLPEGKWSHAEFLEKAKALTTADRFGFEFANWMPGWVTFLWNHGADVLSPDGARASGFLDSEKSIEAIGFVADLVSKHKVSPSLSQTAAAGVDYFATGRASMKVVGHWFLVGLAASQEVDLEDVVVVELPTELDRSETVMYEAGLGIGGSCKHPQKAWEFIKYWTGHGVQSKYNTSGIAVSARKDVEEAKLADKTLSPRAVERNRAFQRIVPSARPPWGSRVEGYDRVEDNCQKAMDAVLKNGVPVKEAFAKAARDIDLEFSRR